MGSDTADSDLLFKRGMPAWRTPQTMPKQTPDVLLYHGQDCGIVSAAGDFGKNRAMDDGA